MPDSAGRRRAVSVAILATAIIIALIPAAATSKTAAPAGLDRFLYALGEIESGGNYTARNPVSGAYGKYQIMPSNWPSWAKIYIGSATAPQSPANQERVARGKVTSLHQWLGSWPNVAHWWLTGSSVTNKNLWSSFSRAYVDRIMAIYRATPAGIAPPKAPKVAPVTGSHIGQSAASIKYAGGWSMARLGSYSDGRVKYAVRDGATATFTFTGRSVAWVGPVGPTRGRARVFVDGKYVGIVDLRRSSFKARATLFRKTWVSAAEHTVLIKVIGSGRPVAVDEFFVGR